MNSTFIGSCFTIENTGEKLHAFQKFSLRYWTFTWYKIIQLTNEAYL